MSVDKNDPSKEDSEESMESSPEGDAPVAPPQQQAESQQPKRKGGRKPVCVNERAAAGSPLPRVFGGFFCLLLFTVASLVSYRVHLEKLGPGLGSLHVVVLS